MRIAVAVLADAANIRENLVNVLSAGVNTMGRSEFPAPLGASLVILGELSGRELSKRASLPITISITAGEDVLVSVDGQIDPQPDQHPERSAYVPVAMDLSNVMLPRPGTYTVNVSFGSVTPFSFEFYVSKLDASQP